VSAPLLFKARHHLSAEILAGVDERVRRWERRRRRERMFDRVAPYLGAALMLASCVATGWALWSLARMVWP